MVESLLFVVIALAIFLAVFLILRAVVLWYFRIGEIVTLLQSINDRLGQQGPEGLSDRHGYPRPFPPAHPHQSRDP